MTRCGGSSPQVSSWHVVVPAQLVNPSVVGTTWATLPALVRKMAESQIDRFIVRDRIRVSVSEVASESLCRPHQILSVRTYHWHDIANLSLLSKFATLKYRFSIYLIESSTACTKEPTINPKQPAGFGFFYKPGFFWTLKKMQTNKVQHAPNSPTRSKRHHASKRAEPSRHSHKQNEKQTAPPTLLSSSSSFFYSSFQNDLNNNITIVQRLSHDSRPD